MFLEYTWPCMRSCKLATKTISSKCSFPIFYYYKDCCIDLFWKGKVLSIDINALIDRIFEMSIFHRKNISFADLIA